MPLSPEAHARLRSILEKEFGMSAMQELGAEEIEKIGICLLSILATGLKMRAHLRSVCEEPVITSYSIHYTKLYDFLLASARSVVLSGHGARDGYADQLEGPMMSLQQAMDLVWLV